jgi:hypothetical protein
MTNNGRSRYFDEPLATQLEIKREEARKRRRITYDCFHAVFNGGVRCARGHLKRRIPLLTVLRGRSTAACVKCADYDDGGEPCG